MKIPHMLRHRQRFLTLLPNVGGFIFLGHKHMGSCNLQKLPLSLFAVSRLWDEGQGLANLTEKENVVQSAWMVGIIINLL